MLIVGLFIRLHTEETLDFQKQKRRIIKKSPFLR
ncbi:transmembrane transport protein [Escherichia coli]|nr:transmembrane transport protein [Escherichia coli]